MVGAIAHVGGVKLGASCMSVRRHRIGWTPACSVRPFRQICLEDSGLGEMVGCTLSHYRIERELGRGGMGAVFQATDTRLDRSVAIKILPESALNDPTLRVRFEREARLAARLNHPNIATVYEIDEASPEDPSLGPGLRRPPMVFIAMEFVAGRTISEIVSDGPLSEARAIEIGVQLLKGLANAHGSGLVHRDVKSANVMVTDDGLVKILDFGLAKGATDTGLTVSRSTVGTLAYMSPEQIRGEEATLQSDLFSAGVVLYEMLAGRRPFRGDYDQAIAYSILNEDPEPISSLRPDLPTAASDLIGSLLSKEARERPSTAEAAASALGRAATDDRPSPTTVVPAAPSVGGNGEAVRGRLTRRRVQIGLIVVLSISAISVRLLYPESSIAPTQFRSDAGASFRFGIDDRTGFTDLSQRSVAIHPHDEYVAYASGGGVFVRYMTGSSGAVRLPGVTGVRGVFMSPRGDEIGLVLGSGQSDDGLAAVDLRGRVRFIADLAGPPLGVSWGTDGYIYFGLGPDGIARVSSTGGTFEVIISPDVYRNGVYSSPSYSPELKAIIYSRAETGRWNESDVRAYRPDSGVDVLLAEGAADGRVMGARCLVFMRDGHLFAAALADRGMAVEAPAVMASETVRGSFNLTGIAQYDISSLGTLAKIAGSEASDRFNLTWLGRVPSENVSDSPRNYYWPALSPVDGRLASVIMDPSYQGDIWLFDHDMMLPTRFTSVPGGVTGFAWSPNENRIAYSARTDEGSVVVVRSTDQFARLDTVAVSVGSLVVTDWSGDGAFLVMDKGDFTGVNNDVVLLDLTSGKMTPQVTTTANDWGGRVSPDGQWIAYVSDSAGRNEVYVVSARNPTMMTRITDAGGENPRWSPDGTVLYFVDDEHGLSLATFDPRSGTAGMASKMLAMELADIVGGYAIDHRTGSLLARILVPEDDNRGADIRSVEVITSWGFALQRSLGL